MFMATEHVAQLSILDYKAKQSLIDQAIFHYIIGE